MRKEAVMLFVGPRGASDERVAPFFRDVACDDILPVLSAEALYSTVDLTKGSVGIIPLEDNMRGEFHGTYDALVERVENVHIFRVATLEEIVSLQVLDERRTPEVVFSHPDILAQYATFFQESGIESIATANTSVACEMVKRRGNPLHAALAPDVVAAEYGLSRRGGFSAGDIVVRTRYGLLGHAEEPNNGSEYASILYVEPTEDKAGTLLGILGAFVDSSVNLRRLRSQNRGDGLPHGFIIELDGHVDDASVSSALGELSSLGVARKTLGVFPAGPTSVSPEKPVNPKNLTP